MSSSSERSEDVQALPVESTLASESTPAVSHVFDLSELSDNSGKLLRDFVGSCQEMGSSVGKKFRVPAKADTVILCALARDGSGMMEYMVLVDGRLIGGLKQFKPSAELAYCLICQKVFWKRHFQHSDCTPGAPSEERCGCNKKEVPTPAAATPETIMILPDLSEIKDVNGTLLKDFVKDLCGLPNATSPMPMKSFLIPGFSDYYLRCTRKRAPGDGLMDPDYVVYELRHTGDPREGDERYLRAGDEIGFCGVCTEIFKATPGAHGACAAPNLLKFGFLCGICKEQRLRASEWLLCAHYYCSRCIFKYCNSKNDGPLCPECRVPLRGAKKRPRDESDDSTDGESD